MYNRLLVPLDGSELAEVTLWYAARLAGRLNASLTLVYVATPEDLASSHLQECYLQDTASRVKADAEKAAAESRGGQVTVDYKILKGDPAEEIIDYADKFKSDLIIMSTQGKSGIRRWPLGNVANKVISATHKQVLLIRAKGGRSDVYHKKLTKVLVPVDGSRESESVLKFISYLAGELKLELTVLHMLPIQFTSFANAEVIKETTRSFKKQEAYIKKLGARLKAEGLTANTVFKKISTGEEAAEIIKLAEDGQFSMVAMATHGRSGLGRWIFGSVANHVLHEGNTPLLLVRPVKGRVRTKP
jgi:nucleotide-binding universal stress UspA family protein